LFWKTNNHLPTPNPKPFFSGINTPIVVRGMLLFWLVTLFNEAVFPGCFPGQSCGPKYVSFDHCSGAPSSFKCAKELYRKVVAFKVYRRVVRRRALSQRVCVLQLHTHTIKQKLLARVPVVNAAYCSCQGSGSSLNWLTAEERAPWPYSGLANETTMSYSSTVHLTVGT
jgi:hypothetical protein